MLIIGPEPFFLYWPGCPNGPAQKQKSRATKNSLMQNWVFRLGHLWSQTWRNSAVQSCQFRFITVWKMSIAWKISYVFGSMLFQSQSKVEACFHQPSFVADWKKISSLKLKSCLSRLRSPEKCRVLGLGFVLWFLKSNCKLGFPCSKIGFFLSR